MRDVVKGLRRAVKALAIEGLARGVVFLGLTWLLAAAWRQGRRGEA
jgi:hypothetical protein